MPECHEHRRPLDKGIIHVPAHNTPMTPSRRDTLLMAIAKAQERRLGLHCD
jgi:hypothetical protein